MISKGDMAIDPRGLIWESYRIDGITAAECRMIFLDWAMSSPAGDMKTMLSALMTRYGAVAPDHPMTGLIAEGLARAGKPVRRKR